MNHNNQSNNITDPIININTLESYPHIFKQNYINQKIKKTITRDTDELPIIQEVLNKKKNNYNQPLVDCINIDRNIQSFLQTKKIDSIHNLDLESASESAFDSTSELLHNINVANTPDICIDKYSTFCSDIQSNNCCKSLEYFIDRVIEYIEDVYKDICNNYNDNPKNTNINNV